MRVFPITSHPTMRPAVLIAVVLALACAQSSTIRHSPNPAHRVNGTWVTREGEFKILALDDTTLQVEFRAEHEYLSPAGPMASVGTGEGTAILKDGRARFRPSGAEAECAITLRFAGERMDAAQTGACGFGLNVTAAGGYRRVSRAEPHFGL